MRTRVFKLRSCFGDEGLKGEGFLGFKASGARRDSFLRLRVPLNSENPWFKGPHSQKYPAADHSKPKNQTQIFISIDSQNSGKRKLLEAPCASTLCRVQDAQKDIRMKPLILQHLTWDATF